MKFSMKPLWVILAVFIIILVVILLIVNLRLVGKIEKKGDMAPAPQRAAAPKAVPSKAIPPKVGTTAPSKASVPTPLVNMSVEEVDRFLPNAVADAVFLEREDVRNPITQLMTLRRVYGLPGQYGSYVEIHVDRGCTYSPGKEAAKEEFEEVISKAKFLQSLNQYSDGYFLKRYNNYAAVVYIHQGGQGRTAFFDYSWFRFNVICTNSYNSMYYIDAGIQSLLNNLGLNE